MVYNFNEEINEESTQRFLNFVNGIPPLMEAENGKIIKEPLTLYLNSVGGFYDLSNVIVDVLNNYEGEVRLVGYGQLASCAFDLFFNTNVKRELMLGVYGMYHMASANITINEHGKPHSSADSNTVERMKVINIERTKSLMKKLKMTAKEQNIVLKGNDLYLTNERMNELLSNVQ